MSLMLYVQELGLTSQIVVQGLKWYDHAECQGVNGMAHSRQHRKRAVPRRSKIPCASSYKNRLDVSDRSTRAEMVRLHGGLGGEGHDKLWVVVGRKGGL